MIGDTIGIFTTAITGCTKMSKMIGYGTRLFSRVGNMALGVYNITNTICNLYDKHHNQKLDWDKDSTFLVATSLLSVELLTFDAIDFAHGLSNFDAIKYDIETSQCFVAGTLVLTIDGNKPIEEIQAGDLVYSTDPETGESEYKEVVRAFRKESDVIIHIFVNDEEIETTPQHPFWVEDEWVSAKDLREGDVLTLADGTTATIENTYGEKLDTPVIVYNFEVQDFHTYYITRVFILVHNANLNGCSIKGNSNSVFDEETRTWTATNPKGTLQTYEVHTRNDIDWDLVRTSGNKKFIGTTNAYAASYGQAPQLDDGSFATLHHLGQKSTGGLVEASTRYHGVGKYGQDILHGQFGYHKPNPNYPIDRIRFSYDNREYWQWRVQNR